MHVGRTRPDGYKKAELACLENLVQRNTVQSSKRHRVVGYRKRHEGKGCKTAGVNTQNSNISLQMEINKSTLKYGPFNFTPSVLENCEQIYIDEV